jgi:hypothetical protein
MSLGSNSKPKPVIYVKVKNIWQPTVPESKKGKEIKREF